MQVTKWSKQAIDQPISMHNKCYQRNANCPQFPVKKRKHITQGLPQTNTTNVINSYSNKLQNKVDVRNQLILREYAVDLVRRNHPSAPVLY